MFRTEAFEVSSPLDGVRSRFFFPVKWGGYVMAQTRLRRLLDEVWQIFENAFFVVFFFSVAVVAVGFFVVRYRRYADNFIKQPNR